jgi:hypothetical protein
MRLLLALAVLVLPLPALAFCGFYVAKADGSLYNEASKVVYVRDGNRSVITMSSDYRGAARDFALVIPTPKVLNPEDVRTVQAETVAHLDAYTAPRLVEYFDPAPCGSRDAMVDDELVVISEDAAGGGKSTYVRADALGVKIKRAFAVGDYDIMILKAEQSDGLVTFLTEQGYKLPDGAQDVLARYIRMGMKFFVARVNLARHSANKAQDLPPLQISFRSRDFMLPIQLGKLNGDGPQDALFLMLTRNGRVEPENYALNELPTDMNVPTFVEDVFGDFYKAAFTRMIGPYGGIALEYAWDMQWCDPCAADPLSREELEELGVSWLKKRSDTPAQDVFVTRLHAQYSRNQMRADVMFRTTSNRANFQGRYVMNHPFVGKVDCEAGRDYVEDIRLRLRSEAVDLAKATGWSAREIERRIRATVPKSYW